MVFVEIKIEIKIELNKVDIGTLLFNNECTFDFFKLLKLFIIFLSVLTNNANLCTYRPAIFTNFSLTNFNSLSK